MGDREERELIRAVKDQTKALRDVVNSQMQITRALLTVAAVAEKVSKQLAAMGEKLPEGGEQADDGISGESGSDPDSTGLNPGT